MPINRILTSQEDFYIAIRQLDDEINNLRTQLATLQSQIKNGSGNGSGGGSGSGGSQKITFGGDLTGSTNSQTVVGIQGDPISATQPTTNQVLEWNGNSWTPTNLPTIPAAITFAGDLTGTSTSQTVVGLRGQSILAGTPTQNQLLVYTGSAWQYSKDIVLSSLQVTGNSTLTGGVAAGPLTCSTFSASNTASFAGVINANNGIMVANSKTIGFLDAGNTYAAHQLTVGTGNNWTLSSSTTGNAGSYVAGITVANSGAVSIGTAGLTVNSSATIKGTVYAQPSSGDAINITGTDGKAVTIGSSTSNNGAYWWTNAAQTTIYGPLVITGNTTINGTLTIPNYINVQSQYALRCWDSSNTKYGQFYTDTNGSLNVSLNTSGQNFIINSQQVWGGAVNANNQNLSNVNTLTVAGAGTFTGAVNANGSLIVNATGTGTGYGQFINSGNTAGTGRNNPALYSSTGTLDIIATLYVHSGLIINTPANITFGSNWQSWTPTLSANAGTLTPTAWYYAGYIRVGPIVFFSIRFAFNASAGFNYFYVTMPVTGYTPSNNYMSVGNCFCESGPLTMENLLMRWEQSDHVVVQRAGGAAYAAGSNYLIIMSGFYRIA